MTEHEYIRIESIIRTKAGGIEKSDRLIALSSNISEQFKNKLLESYSIDIENMPMTENCEILEKLKHARK